VPLFCHAYTTRRLPTHLLLPLEGGRPARRATAPFLTVARGWGPAPKGCGVPLVTLSGSMRLQGGHPWRAPIFPLDLEHFSFPYAVHPREQICSRGYPGTTQEHLCGAAFQVKACRGTDRPSAREAPLHAQAHAHMRAPLRNVLKPHCIRDQYTSRHSTVSSTPGGQPRGGPIAQGLLRGSVLQAAFMDPYPKACCQRCPDSTGAMQARRSAPHKGHFPPPPWVHEFLSCTAMWRRQ